MSNKVHNNVLYQFACNQNLYVHLWWDLDKFPFTSIMAVVSTRRPVSNIPAVSGICPWLIPWRVRDQVHLWLTVTGFRLMVFFDKIIVGHHGVPHPPSLTQMAFIKCTSMSGQPYCTKTLAICLIFALFESLTEDMAQKYRSTLKNLKLGFELKHSGGVPINV